MDAIDTLDMGRVGIIIEREISMRKTAEIERLKAEIERLKAELVRAEAKGEKGKG